MNNRPHCRVASILSAIESSTSPLRLLSLRFRAVACCPTEFNGIEFTNYSLRHTFATLMMMSHVDPDARDRLLGHRPKDVRARSYEVSPVAYLYDELSKIPALIPYDPSTRIEATAEHELGSEKAVVEPLLRRVR